MTLVQMLLFIEFLSLHHIQDQQQKTQKKIEIEFDTWLKLHGREMSIEQVSWIFSFHGVVAKCQTQFHSFVLPLLLAALEFDDVG